MSNTATIAHDRRVDPYGDKKSLEFGFRARRFALVRELIEDVLARKSTCRILDLGGTEQYWLIGEEFLRRHRHRIHITVVNLEGRQAADPGLFTFVEGSATAPDLLGNERFDVVHSNSVVEHVGDWSEMQRFAANVRSKAPSYYVQTPNFWFAYEPHFRMPAFQFLPRAARIALTQRFALGFFPRHPDRSVAEAVIDHHRLLSTRQMAKLFPDAVIRHEKVFGMRKSILAIRPAAD